MATTHMIDLLGQHLVMLHGANGCRQELEPWAQALAEDFQVQCLNLAGHGGSPLPDVLDMATFTADVIAQMDAAGIERAVLFGYSFGGLVALHLASYMPQRVSGVVALACKALFDPAAVGHLTHLLQVPRLMGIPARREHLALVHQPNDWRELVVRLHNMFFGFGAKPPLSPEDLKAIDCPVLLLSGTQDQIVSPDECRALQVAIGHAGLALFEGRAHPASNVPTAGLAKVMCDWAGRAQPRQP
jgi:pimeloyl-ACP methyl ester carboxylesterase